MSDWLSSSKLLSAKYERFLEMINCVSSSYAEPFAIFKKRANSLFDDLPAPSAIFELMETDHLRICDVSPYTSCFGKFDVALYTVVAKSTDFCQTVSSL